jgi:hypothetical protein
LPFAEAGGKIALARSTACHIPNETERAIACFLLSWSPHLSAAEARELIAESIEWMKKIRKDDNRLALRSLILLSPFVAREQAAAMADEVRTALPSMDKGDSSLMRLLMLFSPHFDASESRSQIDKLRQDLKGDDSDDAIILALMNLSPRLEASDTRELMDNVAIKLAEGLDGTDLQAFQIFTALSPRIDAAEARKYASEAQKRADNAESMIFISLLCPYLPEQQMSPLFCAILRESVRNSRAEFLSALSLMEGGLFDLVGVLPALTGGKPSGSCLETLGGPAAVPEVLAAIHDVMRWWG